ncbi:hypothetical protein H1C71_020731 [Ictidomys tridecemlineatus]|nr:hypothetical protein H1C71_020731 [Ictidomys tridecemlineatus]
MEYKGQPHLLETCAPTWLELHSCLPEMNLGWGQVLILSYRAVCETPFASDHLHSLIHPPFHSNIPLFLSFSNSTVVSHFTVHGSWMPARASYPASLPPPELSST